MPGAPSWRAALPRAAGWDSTIPKPDDGSWPKSTRNGVGTEYDLIEQEKANGLPP
jgi:hypothetical protein